MTIFHTKYPFVFVARSIDPNTGEGQARLQEAVNYKGIFGQVFNARKAGRILNKIDPNTFHGSQSIVQVAQKGRPEDFDHILSMLDPNTRDGALALRNCVDLAPRAALDKHLPNIFKKITVTPQGMNSILTTLEGKLLLTHEYLVAVIRGGEKTQNNPSARLQLATLPNLGYSEELLKAAIEVYDPNTLDAEKFWQEALKHHHLQSWTSDLVDSLLKKIDPNELTGHELLKTMAKYRMITPDLYAVNKYKAAENKIARLTEEELRDPVRRILNEKQVHQADRVAELITRIDPKTTGGALSLVAVYDPEMFYPVQRKTFDNFFAKEHGYIFCGDIKKMPPYPDNDFPRISAQVHEDGTYTISAFHQQFDSKDGNDPFAALQKISGEWERVDGKHLNDLEKRARKEYVETSVSHIKEMLPIAGASHDGLARDVEPVVNRAPAPANIRHLFDDMR